MPESGTYEFPSNDALTRRRRLAESLMLQGAPAEPVRHWTQGLARVVQALVGGYEGYRTDKEERERDEKISQGLLTGMGFGTPATGVTPSPAPARTGVAEALAGTGDKTLPRSVRTNNPGAIEFGRFAKDAGATGSDGRYATFPTMQAGYGAMDKLLGVYAGRGQNTISSIIGGTPA